MKVNIVSHLLPVSGRSIVSREIMLLPELIPRQEQPNRSRPNSLAYCAMQPDYTNTLSDEPINSAYTRTVARDTGA